MAQEQAEAPSLSPPPPVQPDATRETQLTPPITAPPSSPSLASLFHTLGRSISRFRPHSSPTSHPLSVSPSFSSSSSEDEVLLIPLSDDTTSEDDVPMLLWDTCVNSSDFWFLVKCFPSTLIFAHSAFQHASIIMFASCAGLVPYLVLFHISPHMKKQVFNNFVWIFDKWWCVLTVRAYKSLNCENVLTTLVKPTYRWGDI